VRETAGEQRADGSAAMDALDGLAVGGATDRGAIFDALLAFRQRLSRSDDLAS
jgi:hypothetical protein